MKSDDKTHEYRIERLNGENLTDVEKLHAAVYGKIPPHNLFPMKYDTAFAAIQHVGFIAYNTQNMPVAFYGVIPCFIRFEDKIILAAQSADTMTHPDYRYKGLFTELASLTYQLCRSSGIQLVFGFPNQNSLQGFITKLGCDRGQNLYCFVIPCAVFSLKRFLGKIPAFRNWYKMYRQKVLKKYLLSQHGIANSVFNDGYAGVYRDHHYRKYKTYTNNDVIKIGDSTLWVKTNNELLIGDILVKPEDFEGMMDKLKKIARKMGIKEIHFHSSPDTTLYNLFAASYESIQSFAVIFKDFTDSLKTDKIKFTSADIDTF